MITSLLEKIGIKQPKKHSTHKPSVLWRINNSEIYRLMDDLPNQTLTQIISDIEHYYHLKKELDIPPISCGLAELVHIIADNEHFEASDMQQEVIEQIIDAIAMCCYQGAYYESSTCGQPRQLKSTHISNKTSSLSLRGVKILIDECAVYEKTGHLGENLKREIDDEGSCAQTSEIIHEILHHSLKRFYEILPEAAVSKFL